MRALIWPDQVSRLSRLDKAIALFLAGRPPIRSGDALALLPQVLAELPPGPLCIYHTSVTYQFSTAMRQRLEDILIEAAKSRPLYRLSKEEDPMGDWLDLFDYTGECPHQARLAKVHPHGTWMEWMA